MLLNEHMNLIPVSDVALGGCPRIERESGIQEKLHQLLFVRLDLLHRGMIRILYRQQLDMRLPASPFDGQCIFHWHRPVRLSMDQQDRAIDVADGVDGGDLLVAVSDHPLDVTNNQGDQGIREM